MKSNEKGFSYEETICILKGLGIKPTREILYKLCDIFPGLKEYLANNKVKL